MSALDQLQRDQQYAYPQEVHQDDGTKHAKHVIDTPEEIGVEPLLGNVSHAREHAELLLMRNTMSNDVSPRVEEKPGVVIVQNLTYRDVSDKGDHSDGEDSDDEWTNPLHRNVLSVSP